MACYHPIPAYQAEGKKIDGQWTKPPPVLYPPAGTANLQIPCSTCLGCKSARALQWAQRCEHEARSHQDNLFLTLTYDDEHLPAYAYLDSVALQRFFKRLRKAVTDRAGNYQRDPGGPLRYFACGEYGDKNGRPHYHALIFNLGFRARDCRAVGKDLAEHAEFDRLWPYGKHAFGPATPAAAAYIAQYSLKKQHKLRSQRDEGYQGISHRTWWNGVNVDGEEVRFGPVQHHPKPAPFLRMSLKPAIGDEWLRKYKDDLQYGYMVAGGHRHAIPRTYREKLKLQDPALAEDIAIRTAHHQLLNHGDKSDPERLKAAEVLHRKLKQLNDRRRL